MCVHKDIGVDGNHPGKMVSLEASMASLIASLLIAGPLPKEASRNLKAEGRRFRQVSSDSITIARTLVPRFAAIALTSRKSGSGISMVVRMHKYASVVGASVKKEFKGRI